MTLIDVSADLSDLTDEELAWVKNKWGGGAEDAGAESGASRSLLRSTIKYPPPKLGEARDDERSIDVAFKRGGAGTTLKESPQARRYNTTTKDAKKGSFWSYQAASRTPNFYELPKGLWSGTREEWEGLSPGMRREIARQAERRGENKDGARDLAPGQISSSEMSRFRAMPARQQAEVIRLAELVKRYRFSDPEKAAQYQKQLDRLAGDAEWEESKHPRGQPGNAGQFGPGGAGGGEVKGGREVKPEPYTHNYASAQFGNKQQKESAERNRQRAVPEAPETPKAGSLKGFEPVKDPSTLSPEEVKQRIAHADAYSKELAKHPTNEIDTPERHALRKRLIDEIYNKDAGNRKHERDATIILGLPASGKSTIANPVISEKGAIEIDPDIAKAMLPEYENGLGAAAVHEESSDITKDVLKRAMSNGDNFVWPRVDSPQKVIDDVMMLKKLGYKVHLKHLIVDPNEAVKSATSRFLKTGRYVPLELISEFGTKPKETYDKAKHLADSAEEVERKKR